MEALTICRNEAKGQVCYALKTTQMSYRFYRCNISVIENAEKFEATWLTENLPSVSDVFNIVDQLKKKTNL